MAERIVGMLMEIEHLIPEALGGETKQDNLWLARPGCYARKTARIVGIDPTTGDPCDCSIPAVNPGQSTFGGLSTARASKARPQPEEPPLLLSNSTVQSWSWRGVLG